ncbi:Tryptophan synthase alpha chain [Sandaracinus amylolyticus]|uniref:Tryptophan synthase alpha chain n=2 Tax=Sandaracinus amylolyticus TaxID=927083 RepID=A0A0F6VYU3_9BACT|nr:Tryptophan synthase alpha chain [Sandaracinus amylolyticus]
MNGMRRIALAMVLLGAMASSCTVDPYCFDCVEDAGGMDAQVGEDAGTDAAQIDAFREDAGTDAGPDLPDGCTPGAVERCNLADDDCDSMIDEGIDTSTDLDHCGGCNQRCAPDHAFGECVDGECTFTTCDVGFYDLDPAQDGCEYRCPYTDTEDSRCDRADNDCDGRVDENFDLTSDPLNCGDCTFECRFAHASGTCSGGSCVLGACAPGFVDDDEDPANGCEYACTPSDTGVETCNLRDDDCDGTIDEGDPGGGATCGSSTGLCRTGIEHCVGGAITCTGGVSPSVELCNGQDDDCDGTSDDGNPQGGRLCGTGIGTCEPGREVCTGGLLVCTGAITATVEACNGLDDDCDERIDEGDPGGGASCASDTGECAAGVQHCRGGVIACEGATGPTIEVCDGQDDDCDSNVDEGNPGGGARCGTDVGTCTAGTRVCTGGALVCTGGVGPGTESCDALDNDCDSRVDEGNPGGGAACGSDTGECSAGVQVCQAGGFVCTGAVGPSAEACDGQDDDCDGTIDEGNPGGGGSCGVETGACVAGTRVCTGGTLVCTGAVGPGVETCNSIDDDCDGTIDEGNPGGGAACGNGTGECTQGAIQCVGGALVCSGGTGPTTEACDGEDDDCDGNVDEGNPGGGAQCGTDVGTCAPGTRVCTGGSLVCTGAIGATAETCDGLDNDCDARTDEGNPGGGASCGVDTGECSFGSRVCTGGALVCSGGVGPSTETCDGEDDDCDGNVDEGNPGGGGLCGSDVGTCRPGTRVCTGGSLVCTGATGATTETCDALDNDCDTRVDEGNPGGGASCGVDTGECSFGSRVCTGGALVCSGGTGPSLEICDTQDDDCDGIIDEGFNLSSDVNNCGACGNVCTIPGAIARCTMSNCAIQACQTGRYDIDGLPGNGCEYACDVAGAEACNGRDDDCDGRTDESLTPPATFCNPNGVCAGTTAVCTAGGWVCNYPAATYQTTETRCDGVDNDCDGSIDEPFALRGTACNNGELGACRRAGTYVCNAAGTGVSCNAPASGGGTTEICDGLDNDCDGTLDDGAPVSWVPFTSGSSSRWIMQYEASRPDSTSSTTGVMSHRVCSQASRMPWTQVTYAQAQAACSTVGARLCTETEWRDACRSSGGSCRWSYGASCSTYSSTTCNGNDYDPVAGAPDTDVVLATGSLPMCYASWGATSALRVFDMSGNVEEWAERRSAGVNPIRGGAANDTAGGMECGFDFVVAGDTFNTATVGFRCCRATAP